MEHIPSTDDDDAHKRTRKAANAARWRMAHPAASLAASHKWRASNPGADYIVTRRWLDANPGYGTEYDRKCKEKQAGRKRPKRCEVCKKVPLGDTFLHFDHCHKNRHFRGWLCASCNIALGYAKDSSALLRKLADYLDADELKQKEKKRNGNEKI